MGKDVYDVVEIKDAEELSLYLNPLYIIETYTTSAEDYKAFQKKIYTIIKGCYEKKECREYPVSFKFYKNDTEVHTLEFRLFVVNVFLWFPFVNLHGVPKLLDKSFIIEAEQIPKVTKYVNEKIIKTLNAYSIKNIIINRSISEVLYNLRMISIDFSLIMALTISSETFLSIYNENSRIREIMNTRFSLSQQPSEIESELDSLMNEEISIIKGMKDNPIGVILRSGTGIKSKQFAEFTIANGLKPDLEGVTIPLPISTSTLIEGANKPSSHYIDALAARKSLISNKKVMGRAGYFGKIVLLLSRTLSLSKTISDCRSKHYLDMEIVSQKMLEKYNGRYYKLDKEDDLSVIDSNRDKHLIGKTIFLRSPITCACGDEVCHKCFGTTSLLNFDIADGVVGFEIEEVSKVINQMILSTKHLLTTVSEEIKFNDNFYRFFAIYAGEVNPILANDTVENLDDWAVFIDPKDMHRADEMDDDSPFNTYISGVFYVQNLVTKEILEIRSEDDKDLYMTDESLYLMKKGKGYIKFKDMEETTTLFELVIMNNELTAPLYGLMDLLNTNKGNRANMTYSEMACKFTELLLSANIPAMAVSGELIINRLIRKDPDIDFERPDFTKEELEPYQIYTVLKALENNRSALIGLSSQDIKKQLLSDDLVTKKTGTSYIDSFFKKKTSTKRYKDIHDIVKKRKREGKNII